MMRSITSQDVPISPFSSDIPVALSIVDSGFEQEFSSTLPNKI